MRIEIFLLYLATWSIVSVTPGPAVMCSMAQATRYGFRSSLAGIAGIQVGNLLFFICIAFGLGVVLTRATELFSVLRVLGAIYLFYLGLRIIASTFRRSSSAAFPCNLAEPPRRLFLQGLLVQVTNPKALLFVSALLPQFLEPNRPMHFQLGILVSTTVAVDFVVLSSYTYLAQRGAGMFHGSRLSHCLQRLCGAALIFFGFRLAFSRK